MAYGQTPFDQFKEALNGRPGQPIVLGVCQTVAKRLGVETWIVRTAAIVAGFLFSFLTLVAYIALGYFMKETNFRTAGFFKGLWITIQEKCQRNEDRDHHDHRWHSRYR